MTARYFHEPCACPTATVVVNGRERDVTTHLLPDCPGVVYDYLVTGESFHKIPRHRPVTGTTQAKDKQQ